jgi:hypothetical protein
MNIIGETKDGYIVQMTKDEAAQAAGHYSSYSDDWRKLGVGIGTTIKFAAAISYHSQIRQHQDAAKKSAGILRALAEMIDGGLPEVVIPAVTEQEESAA